ncbi:MAG: type II toxin-antitoxin system VapC family toxin [Acidimicrobiales bacterium]
MPRRISEGPGLLLLDTHVWVWYREGTEKRFAPALLARLRRYGAEGMLRVSPLSGWEIATLVSKGRLALSRDVRTWVRQALEAPGVRAAEFTAEIAVEAALLGGTAPRDPADRMLIATARTLSATFVTADAEILAYGRGGNLRVLDAGG